MRNARRVDRPHLFHQRKDAVEFLQGAFGLRFIQIQLRKLRQSFYIG